MPIINIQRRMAEQGRIRLGHKVTGTSKAGKTYTRPDKLSAFRFTSPSERLVREIADTYGGAAAAWDNDGKAEWEVLSDAKAIPVIVVKGGFSQWHEVWSKAGCLHRCDGEKDVTGTPCDPDDPQHQEAVEKPTTRLSVMLSEIETLGVWRMESKGWNAAAELPSMAELAMHVGDLVPATLSLAERSSIVEVNGKPTTSRYVVPVLDLHVTKKRLVELVGGVGGTAALDQGQPAPPAIEAPAPDYWADLGACDTVECCRELWSRAQNAGHMTEDLSDAIKRQAERLQSAPDPTPAPVSDEPVDAEVVDDDQGGDKDALWQQLVAVAGKLDIGMDELQREVQSNTGHTVPDATAADMQVMLDLLVTGEVKS